MTDTNYAVAPGEFLTEWMETENSSITTVSAFLRLTLADTRALIAGDLPVTPATAVRLEVLTSIPAIAWLRHEAAYRADIARLFLPPEKPARTPTVPTAWETEYGVLIAWGTHDADIASQLVNDMYRTEFEFEPGTAEYEDCAVTVEQVSALARKRWAHPELLTEDGVWPSELTSNEPRQDYVPYLVVLR